jgi:hypothetical protein
LSGTIKAGTIIMKVGTIIPQSLRVETELYSHGWEIIKNSEADALDRDRGSGMKPVCPYASLTIPYAVSY